MTSQIHSVDTVPTTGNSRSWWLEILGLISILGFFVGIAWAMYTQFNGTVSQLKFDALQVGQSLSEVEDIMGTPGIRAAQLGNQKLGNQKLGNLEKGSLEKGDVYTWENSTDSMVTAVFVNDKLVSMSAKNLP